MYVGLPKNYSGTAFSSDVADKTEIKHPKPPPSLPYTPPSQEKAQKKKECEGCKADSGNPLSCLINALRHGKSGGIDAEDFLLLGLIALLIGKEGNEDIVFILVMLLLL